MRDNYLIVSLLILSACSNPHYSGAQPVSTVDYVELERYQGRWYEIASYPQWFEKGLTNVSAVYTLKSGYVEVLNSGMKNGVLKQKRGKAKVVKNTGNAKLKVSFFWPFSGNYWIVDLDPDYTWVAVSDPKRDTLWILSRSSTMESSLYATICDRLIQRGFDVTKLVRMKQDPLK